MPTTPPITLIEKKGGHPSCDVASASCGDSFFTKVTNDDDEGDQKIFAGVTKVIEHTYSKKK